jgi:esterase
MKTMVDEHDLSDLSGTTIDHGGEDCFVTIRGRKMHYIDYGGDGDLVIALHGMIQHARVFGSIAPLLVPKYRLIALDMKGRGQSDWDPEGVYRIHQYVKDLQAFLEELQFDRMSLIGTSMGGWIATMFAGLSPERVDRLVLNDSAIGADPVGLMRVADMCASGSDGFENFDHAVQWFVGDRPWLLQLPKSDLHWWVEQHLRRDENGKLWLTLDPVALHSATAVAQRGLAASPAEREISWEQAKKLTMPVLFLRAELSDVVPAEAMVRLKSILPQVTVRVIPGVGHAPSLLEPETRDAISEFFNVGVQSPLANHCCA